MEAQPLPAFISKKPKSIHPPTRQPLDLHSQRHSGGRLLDELGAGWQKKGCCKLAALVGQPSANPREGRENGSQTLLWWLFGGLGGWSAPRCNLCSQAGTRQEQRPAWAGQGPRLPRFLASPGTVSSTTHPQLSCIVITGWNWSTLHNTGRTDGWFVVAENGMGLPVCSM